MSATAEVLASMFGQICPTAKPSAVVTFKLVMDGNRWFASADCPVCGSSFTSGTLLPSMKGAVSAARDGYEDHRRLWGDTCKATAASANNNSTKDG